MQSPKIRSLGALCTGCGACRNTCPAGCISMQYDREGFLRPVVDTAACTSCGACEKRCHVLSEWMGGGNFHIGRSDFYLYIDRDDAIRQASSSGGAFSYFAHRILSMGGIVYASRYNFEAERLEVADTDRFPLEEFRKSKYIESNTLDSFREIGEWLRKGREVLFCGTPCQVAGLKGYLPGRERSRLFTIDFYCHGVPSNRHFTEFKHHLEGSGRRMTAFDFRYKNPEDGKGWHDLVFRAVFDDGSVETRPYRPPYYWTYYRPFEESLLLRQSCYDCRKVNCSQADVTLGDFWNIRRFAPELDDNRGISLVKLHSPRAKTLWIESDRTGTVRALPFEAVETNYRRRYDADKVRMRNRLATKAAEAGFVAAMKRHYRKERFARWVRGMLKKAWLRFK